MINFFLHGFVLLLLLSTSMANTNSTHGLEVGKTNEVKTLYVIVGSDWCAECRRLEKKVLSEISFLSTLQKHDIALKIVDFPQRKKQDKATIKQNEGIAEQFDFKGVFPTLIVSVENDYKHLFYHNEDAVALAQKLVDEFNTLLE